MRACPATQQVAQRGLGASVQLALAAVAPEPNPGHSVSAYVHTNTQQSRRARSPVSPLCVAPEAVVAHSIGVHLDVRDVHTNTQWNSHRLLKEGGAQQCKLPPMYTRAPRPLDPGPSSHALRKDSFGLAVRLL